MRIKGYTCAAALMLSISGLFVAEEASVDQARDTPAKKSDDADSAEALGGVFQATKKSYTLLKRDERTLIYDFNYALVCDQRLILAPLTETSGGTQIYGLTGRQSRSQHTFTDSLTLDYGIWDNLTFNLRPPLVAKYDVEIDTHAYSLGDVFAALRWQPWTAVRGRSVTTSYTTIGLPIGDSLYKTNLDKNTSTSGGYYSLGFGTNTSYVIDLVVLYGPLDYTWNLSMDDMHQTLANNSQLEKVSPGNMTNFNMGMAYALSYDISLVTSYQVAYTLESHYHTTAGTLEPSKQTGSITNSSLGLWTSSDYIVNVSAGLGLTGDLPDVLLGLSIPLDTKGLKVR